MNQNDVEQWEQAIRAEYDSIRTISGHLYPSPPTPFSSKLIGCSTPSTLVGTRHVSAPRDLPDNWGRITTQPLALMASRKGVKVRQMASSSSVILIYL